MPGIGTLGTLVAGGILGLGVLWMIYKRYLQAEKERLELAGHKAYEKTDLEAKKQEEDVKAIAEKAQHEKPVDPTDWR